MEKDAPPPYSAAGTYPQAGFNVPPNQAPPPQGGQPGQGYPPQQPGYPSQQPGYPSQQPGYPPGPQAPQGYMPPPMHQQGGTTVVVTTVPVMSQFGPNPQPVQCPHCHHQITSRLETEAGMKTHLFALVLCLFGCVPCCLIPYCMDSCQYQNHYCPSCGAFLGAYNPDGMAYRRGW